MFRIIMSGNVKRQIVFSANFLEFFLQPDGDALRI